MESSNKPAGLQPGDYCQADEHHDLKEVAERLTAMGWGWWQDYHPEVYFRIAFMKDRKKMIKLSEGYSDNLIPTPEFLSRAEVTAKELGLTPVVPEPFKVGDWVEVIGPDVSGITDGAASVTELFDVRELSGATGNVRVDTKWGPVFFKPSSLRKLTPAEVQAHQEQGAAKEEAARVPKFGDRVEYQDNKGWLMAQAKPSPGGYYAISKAGGARIARVKRHEFKILP